MRHLALLPGLLLATSVLAAETTPVLMPAAMPAAPAEAPLEDAATKMQPASAAPASSQPEAVQATAPVAKTAPVQPTPAPSQSEATTLPAQATQAQSSQPANAPPVQPAEAQAPTPAAQAEVKPAPLPAALPPIIPARNPYQPSTQSGGWIAPKQTPYGPLITQQGPMPSYREYQMNRVIPPEEKKRYMQMAMPMMANMMHLDAREGMNYMVSKYKAKPGLSFDDVKESLFLRANQLNFKSVGENLMWKEFRAVLGDEGAPRVEVFSFCDIAVGRQLLKLIPEMVVFLPCRIAIMEDADKNIWILTLDWDSTWLDHAGKSMGITPELRAAAIEVRGKLDEMMRAAANGDI